MTNSFLSEFEIVEDRATHPYTRRVMSREDKVVQKGSILLIYGLVVDINETGARYDYAIKPGMGIVIENITMRAMFTDCQNSDHHSLMHQVIDGGEVFGVLYGSGRSERGLFTGVPLSFYMRKRKLRSAALETEKLHDVSTDAGKKSFQMEHEKNKADTDAKKAEAAAAAAVTKSKSSGGTNKKQKQRGSKRNKNAASNGEEDEGEDDEEVEDEIEDEVEDVEVEDEEDESDDADWSLKERAVKEGAVKNNVEDESDNEVEDEEDKSEATESLSEDNSDEKVVENKDDSDEEFDESDGEVVENKKGGRLGFQRIEEDADLAERKAAEEIAEHSYEEKRDAEIAEQNAKDQKEADVAKREAEIEAEQIARELQMNNGSVKTGYRAKTELFLEVDAVEDLVVEDGDLDYDEGAGDVDYDGADASYEGAGDDDYDVADESETYNQNNLPNSLTPEADCCSEIVHSLTPEADCCSEIVQINAFLDGRTAFTPGRIERFKSVLEMSKSCSHDVTGGQKICLIGDVPILPSSFVRVEHEVWANDEVKTKFYAVILY